MFGINLYIFTIIIIIIIIIVVVVIIIIINVYLLCYSAHLVPIIHILILPILFQEMIYVSFKLFIRSCTIEYCVLYIYVKSCK